MITATTDYTLEELRTFQQVAAKQISPAHYRRLRGAYCISGAVLLAAGCYYSVQLARGDQDLVVILLALGALYLGAQLLWMGIRFYDYFAKRAMKSIPANAHRNYYSFEDDQIVISNRMRSASYPYEQFGDVYETEELFLFYFSPRNGYILKKSGITGGSAEDLRTFLNSKLSSPVVSLPGAVS